MGRKGRQGNPEFSVVFYLNLYPDLQSAFGRTHYGEALDHWLTAGEPEGRNSAP